MDFETGLVAQLSMKDAASDTAEFAVFRQDITAHVLNSPHPIRKALVLSILEHRSRHAVGLPEFGAVDWSVGTINWATIFALLMKILPIILALFGM